MFSTDYGDEILNAYPRKQKKFLIRRTSNRLVKDKPKGLFHECKFNQ